MALAEQTVVSVIPDGHVTLPKGFRAGAVSAGIKHAQDALDLALLVSDRDCAVAGVFTQNLIKGWPVIVSQERLAQGGVRGVVVNSGCSNSLNGAQGYKDAIEMTDLAARQVELTAEQLTVSSTGVTGELMPMDKLISGLPRIVATEGGGHDFARAILTTDTRTKEIAVRVETEAGSYVIAGCAKGSGMLHPNMATMLAYVTTDANIALDLLDAVHREVADLTINMIDVDGDTSCSDTYLIFANGAAGLQQVTAGTPAAATFRDGLLIVATYLARELARDGEGARHLIQVDVRGAASVDDARLMARTITSSPLVKTAIAGQDPNWGRILVAAGRSGAALEEKRTSLRLQGVLIFERGTLKHFDEAALSDRLADPDVLIEIDLGLGEATATAWGCDLTTDYVHINADYRT